MTRIDGISPSRARPVTRIALWMARRKTRALAGRDVQGAIQPLEAYARVPRLLLGYGMLEEATARLHGVPERLKVLAELKAATLTQCEYCIDIGSQIAARAGISEEQLLALPRYGDSDCFDELEKLVLDYAVGMSSTPVTVSDELFEALRARFDEAQLVELTNVIAVENMRGRFNLALDIGSAGFREGMVCAVPDTVAQSPTTSRSHDSSRTAMAEPAAPHRHGGGDGASGSSASAATDGRPAAVA